MYYRGGALSSPCCERGLGIEPVTTALVVSSAWTLTQKLMNNHPKDAGRYQANFDAFQRAVVGDKDGLHFLRCKSYRFPNEHGPGTSCETVGTWATQGPKDDAWSKYVEAANVLASQATGPAGGGGMLPGPAGAPAGDPNAQPLPGQTIYGRLDAGGGVSPVLLGVGALALLALTMRGKR